MKSISTSLLTSALMTAATVLAGDMTPEGCYSSSAGLTFNATYQYNSIGKCGGACLALNYVTFATQKYDCFCGQDLPPASTSIENSTCSFTCPGFPSDLCGGQSAFSLYLTGLSTSVTNNNANPAETSPIAEETPSSTSSAKPSVVTVGGQTIIVTASPLSTNSSSSSSSSSSSGPSKAGIAAGVVVGLVALSAMGGGLFLYLRNKQRREIEEEHRRQAAVNQFIGGGKPPGSSGGLSFTDTRLDPAVMAQRRMSDGSIADNQDYSRRILKVTNA